VGCVYVSLHRFTTVNHERTLEAGRTYIGGWTWLDEDVEHLARHGVEPSDVLAVWREAQSIDETEETVQHHIR